MDMKTVDNHRVLPRIKAPFHVVLCLLVLLCGVACDDGQPQGEAAREIADEQPARGEKSVVHLYFADLENEYLTAEEVRMPMAADANTLGRAIVDALIRGPRKALLRTIPEGTTLRAFHLLENGTAYVDLSAAAKENHPGGARSELMTIYSLVNSLILNMPDVAAVKILIDGHEATTLAGHIDLRYPFTANMLLIR
ncbi:MAG: GerMN domain-containing protein [Deltaproteobacteria bacterium]|nr:GerMN domain-containing protein [Deltaproteobacteria bacterium]